MMWFVVHNTLRNVYFFYAGLRRPADQRRRLRDHDVLHGVAVAARSEHCAGLRSRHRPEIITGLSVGFENTAAPVIAVGAALIARSIWALTRRRPWV